jgi:oxygen-dependent protoporphyrinogen oxidase
VLRASAGRHGEPQTLQRDDADLARAVRDDLADLLGIGVDPVASLVTRWGGALPQYAPGHQDLVDQVRRAVARLPGLVVCGAAYDGVGVPACIASGQAAAERLLAGRAAAGRGAAWGGRLDP